MAQAHPQAAAKIELDDMKLLRKSMFTTNYEQREHIQQMRMRKLHWDKTRVDIFDSDVDPLDAFCNDNRALRDTDVLENVAVYLTKNELLNCRYVCKFWCLEMGRYLHKRKGLIITDEHCVKAEAVLKNRRSGNPVALSQLCFFDISTQCVLYKKLFNVFGYTLSSVSLEECNLSVEDLKRIFVDASPNIEDFHYKEVKTVGGPKISKLKQAKLLNDGLLTLPNMKMLHWDEEDGLTELIDIIETFPNLISLELRNFPVPKSRLFKEKRLSTLRTLFLSPNVLSSEHCKALTYLKLKLQRLTLFGLNPSGKKSMKSLTKFLSSISDTLEVMELWLDYASVLSNPDTVNFSPFPVDMPNVRRLQTEVEVIGQIKNLNKFPSMTELEVVSSPYERQNWSSLTKRVTIKPQEKLTALRCGDIDFKSMSKVMKVFPNITILQLYATHVDDFFFRSVVKNLRNLEDLSIGRCMFKNSLLLTDSGITGISHDSSEELQALPEKLENFDLSVGKIHPAISDLKSLRKLDLGLKTSGLTDISVVLGISKLPRLTCLKLPMCKITVKSLNVIEGMTSLILLQIAGCKDISSEAVESLKKRSRMLIEHELPPFM